MKRYIVILVAVFSAFSAFAQSEKAIYIYRNDGDINAFLYKDIDSLVHSDIGLDGNRYEHMVVQEIWTQDSIYRIPLAAIDSVSFVAPETIVNEDVFELTAEHDPYLSECDTIRFTLSSETPAEMCPLKGNIVVSTYDCLSFPDGIMARVVSRMQDDSGIHYNCEKVGLEDVYDQLFFIGECYAVEDPEESGRRKADPIVYEKELWNKSWSKTLEKGGTTTTLEIGDVARMKVTVIVRKLSLKPTYFRLDLTNELTSSIQFNATSSFEKYFEKELVKKVKLGRIPIPGTSLWITPKIGLTGYFAEGATVSLDCSAHFNRTDKVSFEMKNKKWSVIPHHDENAGVDVASLSMQGYMEVGLIPDMLFSLCGSATGLGIECKVGIKESVDFKFDAVAAFDEGVYSALKDSYARTTVPWSVRAYAQLGLFGDNGIQPFSTPPLSGEPQIGTDKYLLPAFSELEYKKGSSKSTAVLKTQPSRDLLLPVQLGMSFYEGDTRKETKYISIPYRNEEDWTLNGVQVSYGNMEPGKTYTAYPTVKIMDKELRAMPSIDFPEFLLQFKELTWGDWFYANDNVYGTMLAIIEVPSDEDVDLSAYESYGVYVKNNITGEEKYYSVQENRSMRFKIPLEIPRDEFEKDYDSFSATCDKILFSTYTKDKEGKVTLYDEREPEIIYDMPPSITFTKASITGTQVIERDDENRPKRYRTDYSFGMDVIGAFWMSAIQYQTYSTSSYHWNGSSNWVTIPMDASYTSDNGYMEYGSDVNMSHTLYFRIELTDGSILNSTNSLVFGGVPSNPTIYIGGEPSQAPAINVVREDVLSKEVFTSPFEIVKENTIIHNRITSKEGVSK